MSNESVLKTELSQNFNKRSRSIDYAINRVSSTLNATEILVLNFFSSQKEAVYVDRNRMAQDLNRSHNAINDAIVSLVNLNILAFEFDINKKTKKAYTRKKKFILNMKTNEWQKKNHTDYRLKENRFISSLRSMSKDEFNCNLVLATDEYGRVRLEQTFDDRITKAKYLYKTNKELVKNAILHYGLTYLMEWLDSCTYKVLDCTQEQLALNFTEYNKLHKANIITAQRIVFRTRHKTIADDFNELDYLQFRAMICPKTEKMEVANLTRSTLYRHSQRIHNMDHNQFHIEKHAIAVRRVLLENRLVETNAETPYTNISVNVQPVNAQWAFLGGQKYPSYNDNYQPLQQHNGKVYQAQSFNFVDSSIQNLLAEKRVRPITENEYHDLIKADTFNSKYIEQRQINYIPQLENLTVIRSQEELMAKGLINLVRLWDCGAINDIDYEIGYQILTDEAASLPRHCKETVFNPITFIESTKLNYKQKAKLHALNEYLCLNDYTIRTKLKELLSVTKSHSGAFKDDTFNAYLNARFTKDAARELKAQQLSGRRTLYLDPFTKIAQIKEQLLNEKMKEQNQVQEQQNEPVSIVDEFNQKMDQIFYETLQDGYLPPPDEYFIEHQSCSI